MGQSYGIPNYTVLSYTSRRRGPYLDIEFNRSPGARCSRELKEAGYIWAEQIRSWRGTKNFDLALRSAQDAVERSRALAEGRNYGETLCWSCDNACGGCSWSQEFRPIEGWDAEPTARSVTRPIHSGSILRGHRFETVRSYRVRSCPEYSPDRGELARRSEQKSGRRGEAIYGDQ